MYKQYRMLIYLYEYFILFFFDYKVNIYTNKFYILPIFHILKIMNKNIIVS